MKIDLATASTLLKTHHVVGLPTETVYGLAGLASSEQAILSIYKLKNRPAANPLILHVADAEAVSFFVSSLPPDFDTLAHHFWPGPFTMILPIIESQVLNSVRAGLPTAAFRVPNHPLTREIIRQTGPLVMPSANLSGKPSSTSFKHVEHDFGNLFPIVDGGPSTLGLESTIVHFHEGKWVILRQGSISAEDIEAVLGYRPQIWSENLNSRPLSPGQLYRHYAPQAQLLEGERNDTCGIERILGFEEVDYSSDIPILSLGSLKKPESVAENLYAHLRQLDEWHIKKAWVDFNFPEGGLWDTIRERLKRASRSESIFD